MKKPSEIKSLYPEKVSEVSEDAASIKQMGEVERFTEEEMDSLKIIYAGMDNLKVLNVFRELRTQLMQESKKNNFICMVSSICHGGGASYIATNLAAVFALDKSKTSLLLDANLYAPKLDNLIIGDSVAGITDYLHDSSLNIKDIVYATGVPRLRVIPIGENSEGAAEYFSSEKMSKFVREVRARYSDRYVFIDAPPVTDSPEARILSELADLVILVVPHGRVTQEDIQGAVNIVGRDKLFGLVYNN